MILDMKNNVGLRNELQKIVEITDWNDYLETSIELQKQIKAIQNLSAKYPHSISLVKEAERNNSASYKFTCYMYAFDLLDQVELNRIAQFSNEIYPKREFVSYLIDNFLTEIDVYQSNVGDYVIYFNDGIIAHAGNVRRERMISKWGFGHLWKHGVFEVPAEFGKDVLFYGQLPENKCIDAFKTWAKLKHST